MARAFTRREFYDLVWSKPMTHLAKEFVLSDVALHKICKKHDVPNPPLGWWAKKAAGHNVKQTPLPRLKKGISDNITIVSGELSVEPEFISAARESSHVFASTIEVQEDPPANRIVERSIARLRSGKPSEINRLVTIEKPGFLNVSVSVASADRLSLALNRLVAVAEPMGIKLVATQTATAFECDNEVIGFIVTESVKREKHVLTDEERADDAAWRKERDKRSSRDIWDGFNFDLTRTRFPEWDYHPTGLLTLEFEEKYLRGGTPRRSYRDAKVQRLEKMAADIAVGVVVFAAALKEDRQVREEEAQREEERKRQMEAALRTKHILERRSSALDTLLEEVGELDRLRRLMVSLQGQYDASPLGRVGQFIAFAAAQLAEREAALSVDALEQSFSNKNLFGEEDDREFHPPHYF